MKILVYLLCILLSIIIANSQELCDSNSPDYDSCINKEEGFTLDWFSPNIPHWTKHLAHFVNKPNLKFLEIGSLEGRSAIWLLENVLTHPTSNLSCIDNWYLEKYYRRFSNNIKNYLDKINIVRNHSSHALRKYEPVPTFDFIYIDGCHLAPFALEDIVLSFPLLKPGGVFIFDDYMIKREGNKSPKFAIDSFLTIYAELIDVIHIGYQVIVKRKEDVLIKIEYCVITNKK
jgi:predicted O-methyltransferase YrrM